MKRGGMEGKEGIKMMIYSSIHSRALCWAGWCALDTVIAL
jgi:hypothetical protein